ncbi:hypothetical protein HN592_03120 [Candidatus Woesearchaeota archaeon]|jgi:hypothetical protein|nr:hypothetical protein [Candidatus Woesearchaeota archaeon]MBT4368205.1 hypothetical protein [Candidatus Woesearchaeota archaeon]MBT4712694.1 hypothetical protein [Candidatus Woesearchaeota archaeon]MBT6639606.1 hypothetical protein [Candidatus Woesearchaeota archaeon]MBT7133778.1 hypothetical protein [Candidatus Woesearchaeota archaeon]
MVDGRHIQPNTVSDGWAKRFARSSSGSYKIKPHVDYEKIALSVVKKVGDLTSGMFLVNGLLGRTGIELIALTDFEPNTLKSIYGLLKAHPPTVQMAYAQKQKLDNVWLNFKQDELPVTLTMINQRAIDALKGLNLDNTGYVRCMETHVGGQTVKERELLRNLRGGKRECVFPCKQVQGELHCGHGVAHFEDGEVYVGQPLLPFLLGPETLVEGILTDAGDEIRNNLRTALRKTYGESSDRVSLVNALPRMTQSRLNASTRKYLTEFF